MSSFLPKIGLLLTSATLVALPMGMPVAHGQDSRPGQESVVPPERRVSDREARLAKGRVLASNDGSVKAALDVYRGLAGEYPDDLEIRSEYASILMRVNRFDEALQSWKAILDVDPRNYLARLNAGKCLLWTKQDAKAIQILEGVVASDPSEPDAYMFLARAYTSLESYDKAISRAESYRKLKGASTFEGLAEVGDAYFGASIFDKAIPSYKAALRTSIPKTEVERLFDIRKRLALSLSWSQESDEALPLLAELNRIKPSDDLVAIELARAYSRRGDFSRVVPTLDRVLSRTSKDDKLKWDAADLYLAIGHFKQAAKLYAEVVAAHPDDDALSVGYADRMNSWGAFDEAARRYRLYLQKAPDDRATMLKLARCLASAEQSEAAESVYRSMVVARPHDIEALEELVALKLLEGDEGSAGRLLALAPKGEASTAPSNELRADIAAKQLEFEKAEEMYAKVEAAPLRRLKARNKRAAVLAQSKRLEESRSIYAETAKLYPKDIESRYYLESTDKKLPRDIVTKLLSNPEFMPVDMLEWGRLSIKNGDTAGALRFYDEAAKRDPEFIPVKMAYAELLGVESQYDRSLEVYQSLLVEFPKSTKIRTEYARTLAFSRRYDEAIAEFRKLHDEFKTNRTVIREAARVAFWGKRYQEGRDLYHELLDPPVDSALASRLVKFEGTPGITAENDVPYDSFERVVSSSPNSAGIPYQNNPRLARAISDLYGEYRLQKEVSLELASKLALYNKRPREARKALDELVDFEPGNKEAIFDLAQVSCAQDDIEASRACYDRLLALAPLHKVAPEARERLADRRTPAFLSSAYGRSENGRGELARFSRSLFTAGFETPVSDSTTFAFLANYAREVPHDQRESYDSLGPTLDVTTRLDKDWKVNAHWTYRQYEGDEFDDRHTGAATVWYSYADWTEFSAGYIRADEIYNRFGLEDGLQSDTIWFAIDGKLSRTTEYRAEARQLWYTDSNNRQLLSLDIAEALTEQPRTFKIGLRGEYHDTSEENVFIAGAQGVEDIVHPYWTPQQYASGFLTFEWFHELNEILFCHQRRHFYRIRTEPFMATDGNVGAELSGEWMVELENNLGLGLGGSIQRSQLYDAEQGLLFVRYAF